MEIQEREEDGDIQTHEGASESVNEKEKQTERDKIKTLVFVYFLTGFYVAGLGWAEQPTSRGPPLERFSDFSSPPCIGLFEFKWPAPYSSLLLRNLTDLKKKQISY